MEQKLDAIIIGWGKGGKTLAAALAKRGLKTAMVEESDQMYGGTCINVGCIPTKCFVHAAKLAHLQHPQTYEEKNKLYQNALAAKNAVVSALRKRNFDALNDNTNVAVFHGKGSFAGPDRVKVTGPGGETVLTADKIFINTGAKTALPKIAGIEDNPRVYTSTSVLDMAVLPQTLVVVGGGYIGLEFASIFANFGSQVTVLEAFDDLLPREDREIIAELKNILGKKGVLFEFNAGVSGVDGGEVHFTDASGRARVLKADAVLLAAGRVPNTDGLNLAAAGIETGPRGEVRVDDKLQTSNPRVWALGDVKGGLQFTYVSLDDYRIVLADVFDGGNRTVKDREPVVYSMFTDPVLSHVGLTEAAAKKAGYEVKTKKISVAAIPRAKTIAEAEGLMKSVVDAKTGKILGCTLLAPDSSEDINLVSLALKAGLDYTFVRDFVYTHPSMAETLNDLFAF